MSSRLFVIDTSDKSLGRLKKNLKWHVLWTWLTGKPSHVNHYTIETEGKEIMRFYDKYELRKFANMLLREASKSRNQAVKERGKVFGIPKSSHIKQSDKK